MKQFAIKNSKSSRFLFKYGQIIVFFFMIIALFFTFVIIISDFPAITKLLVFGLILISYFFFYKIINSLNLKQVFKKDTSEKAAISKDIFDSDVDEKLLVLEEAGKFFGASLKTEDMFRLVSSRIGDIIAYRTCAFFLIDETNKFTVPFAVGKNSRLIESIKIECNEGLAGKVFLSRQIESDNVLALDKKVIENAFFVGLNSAIAIPLFRGDEVFCVLVLYRDEKNNFIERDEILTKAIGERITPLIISSFSYEKSLSRAMTDSITNLPNERAFFLVLENQVAEAQRYSEQRNLTVLAIDIKNFANINEKYGHSTGDEILAFAAETIKGQLRTMDLLSRTVNDEFLIVLPTATQEISENIIKRLENVFKNKPFELSDIEQCFIELSFGSASFKNDGETAAQLIKTALIRKLNFKSNGQNSVIFFPKQYLN